MSADSSELSSEGAALLASGALFRLGPGAGPAPRVPEDTRVQLLAGARGAGEGLTAAAHLAALAAGVREGSAGAEHVTRVLTHVWATRGTAADFLLQQGEDELSEAGEAYLRSAEWARRALAAAPWDTPTRRDAAADLLDHMARLEEDAARDLLRWAQNQ